MIKVENLVVKAEGVKILDGVSLEIIESKTVLLMGPNGSGKSTLAMVLLGDKRFEVVSGKIVLQDQKGSTAADLLELKPHERAKLGLYVGFQNPVEVPGVSAYALLLASYRQLHPKDDKAVEVDSFTGYVDSVADELGIERGLLGRGVNEGFSGGEKKKLELLQMVVLKPRYVILDEPDSGLDADSLKLVRSALGMLDPNTGVLLISHDPGRFGKTGIEKVYVMKHGKVVKKGGAELIDLVGREGYESL